MLILAEDHHPSVFLRLLSWLVGFELNINDQIVLAITWNSGLACHQEPSIFHLESCCISHWNFLGWIIAIPDDFAGFVKHQ